MKPSRTNYTMLELIAALGALALLSACFLASLKSLAKMEWISSSENRAILVLDNVLERAESIKKPSAQDIKRVFDSEYSKSPLGDDSRIHAAFVDSGDKVRLRILKPNGKPLAEVEVKCGK